MTVTLTLHGVGPGLTVQDAGRPGHAAAGLSPGGAVDWLALAEAAALLGSASPTAAIEIAGFGGEFSTNSDTRIALTGAPMRAAIDGRALIWNASHRLEAGQSLTIGAALRGSYGYLSFAGGIAVPEQLGSRAAHLTAGIGRRLVAGDTLPLRPDRDPLAPPLILPAGTRFGGGTVRVVPGPQTPLFPDPVRAAFAATTFHRNPRGNRQGVRLDHDGAPFSTDAQLAILSDLIVAGDIQITGDGVPFVLLSECQTIGGYPRIGTVIPEDLPIVAQAAPGAALRFRFVTLEEADVVCRTPAQALRDAKAAVRPLTRDPSAIADLLSHQLISGATAGDDLDTLPGSSGSD